MHRVLSAIQAMSQKRLKGRPKIHGINTVRERDREAHRHERDKAKQKSAERWFLDVHKATSITAPTSPSDPVDSPSPI
jgi:hypothetical protein